MLEYTRIESPMEIRAARDNVLRGTADGIPLVVVLGSDDVLRTVKLALVLVPGLKRNIFSSLTAAKKGVERTIKNNGSSLDLGALTVRLTRLDSMEYLDTTAANKSRKTESALCAISGKTFGKESVLTPLVPNKPVSLSVGSTNVDQRVVENS